MTSKISSHPSELCEHGCENKEVYPQIKSDYGLQKLGCEMETEENPKEEKTERDRRGKMSEEEGGRGQKMGQSNLDDSQET